MALSQIGVLYSQVINKSFYIIGDKMYSLTKHSDKKILASSHCKIDIENSNCLAISSLKKINEYRFEKVDRIGGKHPGSALCKKHLKAKVVMSKMLRGGGQALCQLEDKSIISLDTLYYYWRVNP